jgi:aminopeptidase N
MSDRSVAIVLAGLLATPLLASGAAAPMVAPEGPDFHSFANVREAMVRHLDLYLDVDFPNRRLSGVVDLQIERLDPASSRLVLDTRDLVIREVWQIAGAQFTRLPFALGDPLAGGSGVLGRPLTITLPPAAAGSKTTVRISYQTQPQASGLQWLTPAQTAGKSDPFLFSQSQAIHARSWIPLQDSPQVRATYTAQIHVPPGLRAVMSANNLGADNRPQQPADGVYRFEMPQAIPSYLIAIGVGRLDYRELGPRTAIYAEPPLIETAAREFVDTEKMVAACEQLFGPYRWGRYDMLVLPPSFPFGGMENPRLTFLTPTIIAGDRSLVSLIAHELAHSWSGNLVTNATWRDFWLNEGFTVFLESRIVEKLYGEQRAAMEDVLGLQTLQRELRSLPPGDQVLAIDLRGRDPDDGVTTVPYEKGRLFLRWLESRYGRAQLDTFLKSYFDHFAFQSITTEQFRSYLLDTLIARDPSRVSAAELDQWLLQPGLPSFAALPSSDAFARIDALRAGWLGGSRRLASIPGAQWSTQEWLHFLDGMPARVVAAKLQELDAAFALTASGNAEIAHSWLLIAIHNDYRAAYPRLESYLISIGRRKLIKPLYEALVQTADGRAIAQRIYAEARAGYHPIAIATLDPIVRGAARAP